MEHAQTSPETNLPVLTEDNIELLIEALRRDPERLAEVVSRAGPEDVRGDGWTPFARRLFLSVLADTGRVTTACDWSQMSKQSAYALRARDTLFAAGWDAACEIARGRLADALYEKALDGVTETIVRDGEVVAERHRFDSRLSIAVLHRLDKRCDRAEEQGSRHLPAVRNWEQFLTHISRGEDGAAEALLQAPAPCGADGPSHGQPSQLPLGESPIGAAPQSVEDDQTVDLSDRCWRDEDGTWMTNFPPPPRFVGFEKGQWQDYGYRRHCTNAEAAILEADEQAAIADDRAQECELRDAWFAFLAGEQDGSSGNEEAEASPGPALPSVHALQGH